jgi:hypothetical protein
MLDFLLSNLSLPLPENLSTIATNLPIVIVTHPGRPYFQGLDRYFAVCFAICLCFSTTLGLSQDWTETLTLALTLELIAFNDID